MSYITVTFLRLDLSLKITQLKTFAQLRYSLHVTQPWTFINKRRSFSKNSRIFITCNLGMKNTYHDAGTCQRNANSFTDTHYTHVPTRLNGQQLCLCVLCGQYNGYHAAKSTHCAVVCKIWIQYSTASALRHEYDVTSETTALRQSRRNGEKLVVWKRDTLLAGQEDLMNMWIVFGRLSYWVQKFDFFSKCRVTCVRKDCPQNSSKVPTSKTT
jgi:hypothetical protein